MAAANVARIMWEFVKKALASFVGGYALQVFLAVSLVLGLGPPELAKWLVGNWPAVVIVLVRVGFIVLAALAAIALIYSKKTPRRRPKLTEMYLIGGSVSLALSIVLFGLYYLHDPAREELENFAQRSIRKLGKPLGGLKKAEVAGQVFMDNAIVLWSPEFGQDNAIYIPHDTTRKVVSVHDGARDDDLRFYDLNWLRATFKVPPDRIPPAGGVARRWLADPQKFEWTGFVVWQAQYAGTLYYQLYEKGLIVGPLRTSQSDSRGRFYAIFKDGTWTSQGTSIRAAAVQP